MAPLQSYPLRLVKSLKGREMVVVWWCPINRVAGRPNRIQSDFACDLLYLKSKRFSTVLGISTSAAHHKEAHNAARATPLANHGGRGARAPKVIHLPGA